jgi:two-component system C4-dicarboxylate transport sensor histidine kinase DctB
MHLRRDNLLVQSETIQIWVEDEGPGVPPAIRERIFDPGFTTRGVGVGVGLGLSIAYRIAASHGGKIEVTDRPTRGAAFLIELRAA